LIVYVPVYVDQSGLSPKQRIDAEQKFIKLQGIYEFERFKEHRKVDHYERTKVYDVTQVVKLSSKSKENPTVLKSQFELKCLVDDFIENTIKNNPKLNKFNQTFFNEVEKHFKQIQGALDPDVKTKYIPETINKQKEFRLNEMHTALANKVLKLADATNKIKKTYGNSHSIGQACKNLTAELKTFMSKTFKNHFENEFHYVYAALDNDVKAALKNDQQHDLG
jgi:hypothetical protein